VKKSSGSSHVKIVVWATIASGALLGVIMIWHMGWIPRVRLELPAPSATPLPTASPKPTLNPKPSASASPKPTDTPKPIETPKPTPRHIGEPGDPSLVTPAPDGWKVEQLEGVNVRMGPVKVEGGDATFFVVPAYQFVPQVQAGGVYLMEPGRDESGNGETIVEELDNATKVFSSTRDALDKLDETLLVLKKYQVQKVPSTH